MIDTATKTLIADALTSFCERAGSQNKAAAQTGISGGTISNMIAGKWANMADDIWRRISKAIGFTLDEAWKHVDTKPYQAITNWYADARMHANVYGVICHPGSGKTHSLRNFIGMHPDVLYVKCNDSMTKRSFYAEILRTMGKLPDSYSADGMACQIELAIAKMESPLLIIDEMELAKEDVFLQGTPICNRFEDKCGIVFLGTESFKKKLEAGCARKKGYNTFFDRISRFIEAPKPTSADVAAIVRANGIVEDLEINSIINDCINYCGDYSLRRVKRLVHKEKLLKEGKAA